MKNKLYSPVASAESPRAAIELRLCGSSLAFHSLYLIRRILHMNSSKPNLRSNHTQFSVNTSKIVKLLMTIEPFE